MIKMESFTGLVELQITKSTTLKLGFKGTRVPVKATDLADYIGQCVAEALPYPSFGPVSSIVGVINIANVRGTTTELGFKTDTQLPVVEAVKEAIKELLKVATEPAPAVVQEPVKEPVKEPKKSSKFA